MPFLTATTRFDKKVLIYNILDDDSTCDKSN
jgi:hypothetical protein